MKRTFATLALITAMFQSAHADAVVDDLQVRRSGDNVNIRVGVRNPAGTRQKGPIVVDLYVRQGESDSWTKIKTWSNVNALAARHRIARDYFDANSALLKDLAGKGRFQARAVVTAPGQKDAAEKTSWYDSTAGDY